MTRVTVYQFQCYDTVDDRMRTSRRWATRLAVEYIKVGVILETTGTEVDSTHLDGSGMTEIDFDPRP